MGTVTHRQDSRKDVSQLVLVLGAGKADDLCGAGEWRADAAVEWRLSPDSKLLDLTFEEVFMTLHLWEGKWHALIVLGRLRIANSTVLPFSLVTRCAAAVTCPLL